MYDPQTGLVFLRARYYNMADGRFMSKDAWAGDKQTPMSYNAWQYVYGNPVNLSDPSGLGVICPDNSISNCYFASDGEHNFGMEYAINYEYADTIINNSRPCPAPTPNSPNVNNCLPSGYNGPQKPAFDGYAIGFMGSVTYWPSLYLRGLLDPNMFCADEATNNQVGFGVEIVYDFRHQQRARFTYHFVSSAVGTAIGIEGGIGYESILWGFKKSINDYQGFSFTRSGTVNLPLESIGITGSYSIPLTRPYGNEDVSGVYGFSLFRTLGLGISAPINLTITNLETTINERSINEYYSFAETSDHYGLDDRGRNDILERINAANNIISELGTISTFRSLGGSYLAPLMNGIAMQEAEKWKYFY